MIDADAIDADGDGYTEADGDCDDDDIITHPEAAEICDGRHLTYSYGTGETFACDASSCE